MSITLAKMPSTTSITLGVPVITLASLTVTARTNQANGLTTVNYGFDTDTDSGYPLGSWSNSQLVRGLLTHEHGLKVAILDTVDGTITAKGFVTHRTIVSYQPVANITKTDLFSVDAAAFKMRAGTIASGASDLVFYRRVMEQVPTFGG